MLYLIKIVRNGIWGNELGGIDFGLISLEQCKKIVQQLELMERVWL